MMIKRQNKFRFGLVNVVEVSSLLLTCGDDRVSISKGL